MKTQAQFAADLASAAATRIDVDGELSTSARTAKRTARDQLLEAAFNLMTGNIPIHTAGGWLLKSKSNSVGKLVNVKIGGMQIVQSGSEYALIDEDGVYKQIAEPTMEFYVQSGKTYLVSARADHCTCGGAEWGKTCWHLCCVEFWLEAATMVRQGGMHSTLAQRRATHQRASEIRNPLRRQHRVPVSYYRSGGV